MLWWGFFRPSALGASVVSLKNSHHIVQNITIVNNHAIQVILKHFILKGFPELMEDEFHGSSYSQFMNNTQYDKSVSNGQKLIFHPLISEY